MHVEYENEPLSWFGEVLTTHDLEDTEYFDDYDRHDILQDYARSRIHDIELLSASHPHIYFQTNMQILMSIVQDIPVSVRDSFMWLPTVSDLELPGVLCVVGNDILRNGGRIPYPLHPIIGPVSDYYCRPNLTQKWFPPDDNDQDPPMSSGLSGSDRTRFSYRHHECSYRCHHDEISHMLSSCVHVLFCLAGIKQRTTSEQADQQTTHQPADIIQTIRNGEASHHLHILHRSNAIRRIGRLYRSNHTFRMAAKFNDASPITNACQTTIASPKVPTLDPDKLLPHNLLWEGAAYAVATDGNESSILSDANSPIDDVNHSTIENGEVIHHDNILRQSNVVKQRDKDLRYRRPESLLHELAQRITSNSSTADHKTLVQCSANIVYLAKLTQIILYMNRQSNVARFIIEQLSKTPVGACTACYVTCTDCCRCVAPFSWTTTAILLIVSPNSPRPKPSYCPHRIYIQHDGHWNIITGKTVGCTSSYYGAPDQFPVWSWGGVSNSYNNLSLLVLPDPD